ncbi:MAG: FAD-dependent oxidoreductase [Caldilineaceae bacterium]|nr:FAD-dependent oxidoreductase [Caldilineaceae bacterium]
MTNHTRLVIIGAGIVGAAAAYHLAQLGWRDMMVLDKGDIPENDGSTSHAPGGVIALSHGKLMTQLAQYGTELYRNLAPFSPERNTYNAVGGLDVAIGEEKWLDLVRLEGKARSFGVEAHLLSPQETKAKLPLLDERTIRGSIFVPSSALVAGAHVTGALLRDAAAVGGVQWRGQTAVTDVEVKDGRVTAVLTANPDLPRIECEAVLLCTNIWGPVLGDKLGIPIPLMPCEHQYVFLDPLPELARFDPNKKEDEVAYPTARIQDITTYFRQHWDTYGIGNYWHKPLLVSPYKLGKTAMNPFTPDDFTQSWQRAQEIFPAFRGRQIMRAFNGIFAFPVDGYPILGEAQTIKGFWVATGSWLTHAGGVGKSIAEWMTHGETEWDMRQVHLHRFQGFQNTHAFIMAVSGKNYREVWEPGHPRQPLSEPRNVRLSPFAPRLDALNTVYTTFAGLELPNWSEENARLLEKYDDRIPDRTGLAGQYWSRIQGAEHLATRENVALFDLTGLSIIEVQGQGALDFVNYLCSNQMDKPAGSIVYTCWLIPNGGVRRDLAVARLAEDRFWMFVGEGALPQDLAWVKQFAPQDGSVVIHDVSNSYTALGLWGPNARKVLEKVTAADVSSEGFPYMSARWIDVGMAQVYALRISYAGELGWELHIPMDQALPVWDALWEAGREFDLVAAGMGCFESLRLEKGYRLWGGDVYTEYTPYEAGLAWTVRLGKLDFVGKEALLKLKDKPLKKKLCCLVSDDPQAWAFGYEPIFWNGDCIGHVTTANYGYSVGKFIAYGYLPVQYAGLGTQLEVEYLGERWPATVSAEPLWDAKMERLKA